MGWFSDRWNDVKSAASTVKDAASGIAESAKSAVKEFASDPVGHTKAAVTAVAETAEYAVKNPIRSAELVYNGATEGIIESAGSIVGLADLAVNHVIIDPFLNPALEGMGAGTVGHTNMGDGVSGFLRDVNTGINGMVGYRFTPPVGEMEKRLFFTGDAAGQIAGFIGVTVATGGVGGAAFATARGANVARGLTTGAAKAYGWVSPTSSMGAFAAESGFAAYHVTSNMNEWRLNDQMLNSGREAQLQDASPTVDAQPSAPSNGTDNTITPDYIEDGAISRQLQQNNESGASRQGPATIEPEYIEDGYYTNLLSQASREGGSYSPSGESALSMEFNPGSSNTPAHVSDMSAPQANYSLTANFDMQSRTANAPVNDVDNHAPSAPLVQQRMIPV